MRVVAPANQDSACRGIRPFGCFGTTGRMAELHREVADGLNLAPAARVNRSTSDAQHYSEGFDLISPVKRFQTR